MGEIRIDPRKQFSKKLARWTAIFWFVFMAWLSVLFLLAPESALYCVYMGIIVTAVMILNVWAYTRNSIYEKGVVAMLDKARIEIGLANGKTNTTSTDGEGTEDDEQEESEGDADG